MANVDPTVTAITQLFSQLGIAAIFVWAWWQERKERQAQQERFEKERADIQERYDKRYDDLSTRLIGLLESMLKPMKTEEGHAVPPTMSNPN